MKNPFKNKKYKQGTESFLAMYLDKYQFVLGADLEGYSKSNGTFSKYIPCNIYFILRRPKVTIDPNSFESHGKEAKFNLVIHQPQGYSIVNIVTEIKNAQSQLELFTEYPYNLFAINDNRKPLFLARPSYLIDHDIVENNITAI